MQEKSNWQNSLSFIWPALSVLATFLKSIGYLPEASWWAVTSGFWGPPAFLVGFCVILVSILAIILLGKMLWEIPSLFKKS